MEQFEQFAKDHGIEIIAANIAARPDQSDDWSKDAIHFHVTLTRVPAGTNPDRAPNIVYTGFYSVGSAHPMMWAEKNKGKLGYRVRSALQRVKENAPRSIYAENARGEIREAYAKAAPLTAADILLSLQMDAMGCDQPFTDWAADLGYSDDSIKARKIWDACNDTRRALQAAFGRELFEAFEALEE